MLIEIPQVLTLPQVAECRRLLDAAAGWEDTGANLHLTPSSPEAQQIGGRVLDSLQGNSLFMTAAVPLRVFPPLFHRYRGGDRPENTVDNAIRQVAGTPHRIRTDLSATLFLTPPEEYEGGELVVEDAYGAHSAKLPAGHMALYPSTSLSHVRPVTQGERVSSSFWIQSMVRDDGQRTLLFDLELAIQRLGADVAGHPSVAQLTAVYHNLLRRWAEVS